MTASDTSAATGRPRVDPVAGRIHGLDGLRAMAVIWVLAFHLWPSTIPGGFIGVDVFFVVSGFLITTLLLRERNSTGRVDLAGFWTRRARRLLPAIAVVVIISVAVAAVVDSDLLVDVRRHTLGVLTFSTNWVEIAAGSNYFDHTSPSLFVTFWSLAVEEQFYLLWPPILLGLLAVVRWPSRLVRLTLVVAAASALLMAVLYDSDATTRVYYGTDTHLFGIMIGAALAFAFATPAKLLTSGRWQRLRTWVGFVALVGLVILVFTVDGDHAFTYRGGILLASLLTAVMVAALPGRTSAFASLLQVRPLAWTGERSYGIYLWHWPVLLIIAAIMPEVPPGTGPSWVTAILVLVVTFVLAEISYRWIEMPVRRHGFRTAGGRLWSALREPRRSFAVPSVKVAATVGTTALVVLAGFGFATAPDRSGAQQSVEAGQMAIEAQSAATNPPTNPPANPPGTNSETPDAVETDLASVWPPGLAVPPGSAMVALGDSVLSGAAPAVFDRFPGIAIDAKPNRQWRDAPDIVRQMLDAGTMRDVVILNFGTNAGLKDEVSVQALRDTLDALGPTRRVVLVTVVGISYWIPATNATLGEIAAQHPNTIVDDWHATIEARPGLLHSDRTHPNMDGIVVYADVLAHSLEQLGPG